MNQPKLKEVEIREVNLVELVQMNKKDAMLAIAKNKGAQVKKSHTKVKIAEDLAKQIKETFLEQLSYLRSKTMTVIEMITNQTNLTPVKLSQEQQTELSVLESEGYLYINKDTEEVLSISLALELKEFMKEIKMDDSNFEALKSNQKLVDYTLALTHMYGVYPIKQLLKVWNTNQTKYVEIENLTEKLSQIVAKQPDINWNGTIIYDQSFFNEQDACSFYDVLHSRKVPYFMPSKEDLKLYTDVAVNKWSPYYLNIHNFIHLKAYDKQTEERLMSEINQAVILGVQPDKVYESLFKMGLTFNTEEEVITFVQLFQELSNHTRKWNYRGWTPNEVERLQENKTVKKAPIKVNKVGRNEPCPCGSGKKYKKCHG